MLITAIRRLAGLAKNKPPAMDISLCVRRNPFSYQPKAPPALYDVVLLTTFVQ